MKKLFLALVVVFLVLFASSTKVEAVTRVRGYYRSNGTYVQSYYRTSPNSYRYDNYSYRGNYNPYTGRTGTRSYTYGY
jgi:hypothetical protein